MYPARARIAKPAIRQPSTSLCGSLRIISLSLQVPGSDSSAFTTKKLKSETATKKTHWISNSEAYPQRIHIGLFSQHFVVICASMQYPHTPILTQQIKDWLTSVCRLTSLAWKTTSDPMEIPLHPDHAVQNSCTLAQSSRGPCWEYLWFYTSLRVLKHLLIASPMNITTVILNSDHYRKKGGRQPRGKEYLLSIEVCKYSVLILESTINLSKQYMNKLK